jgi:HSP20 family molecular chaperone IbpA
VGKVAASLKNGLLEIVAPHAKTKAKSARKVAISKEA